MTRRPHPLNPERLADIFARRPDLATLPMLGATVARLMQESA